MILVDDLASVTSVQYHGPLAAQAQRVGSRTGHRWAHLSSTPDDAVFAELHAFADRIGMRRAWFQDDHYDLSPVKRAMAVKLGATEVTRMEMAMVLLYDRKGRERPAYGTPEKTARRQGSESEDQLALPVTPLSVSALVVNVKEVGHGGYDVYVGRANVRYGLVASPFANPYRIGRDGDREEVLAKYRAHLETKLQQNPSLREELRALKGKRLGCWCAPLPCHADHLAEIANTEGQIAWN